MSRPVKFSWPVADTDAVCLVQATGAAGELAINGVLASKNDAERRTATFEGLERTVSITSTANLATVVVTVTGTLNGHVVSYPRVGPNNTTVYTVQEFDTITSVTVNAAVPNISIGTGLTGATHWFLSDYHRSNNALAIGVAVTANLTYSFETTFDDVSVIADPVIFKPIDGVTIPVIPTGGNMQSATVTTLANYTIPARFSRIAIEASDATGAAEIVFLQQGIL